MDEDHSEDGGQPSGQENGDADFIEAGEIAAEYEVSGNTSPTQRVQQQRSCLFRC